jgi:hypothetical protein
MRVRDKLKGEKEAVKATVWLRGEDAEAITKVAQMKHLTKAAIIRQALDLYFSLTSVS